jgi:hypothetical protein
LTCRFPLLRSAPKGSGGFAGEVTRLNSDGQFKPFVYLNAAAAGRGTSHKITWPKGKAPPFGGTLLLSLHFGQLTTALALLIRLLALTVRILLLLSGLLATALLLAGLLTRVLVLLARILVRV